jgi:death on curing protein
LSSPSTEFRRRAAGYASGIARNHPFVDGKKRTALLTAYIFLGLNGVEFAADEAAAAAAMLLLASGEISEEAFAEWLRRNTRMLRT